MSRLGIEASFDFLGLIAILASYCVQNYELLTLLSEDGRWLIGLFVTTKLVFYIPLEGMMGEL